MEFIHVHLHKATDAEDSYALSGSEATPRWLAQRGYGSAYEKIWSVELQSQSIPERHRVNWDAVLDRVIEAYDMNDPVIASFEWPLSQTV